MKMRKHHMLYFLAEWSASFVWRYLNKIFMVSILSRETKSFKAGENLLKKQIANRILQWGNCQISKKNGYLTIFINHFFRWNSALIFDRHKSSRHCNVIYKHLCPQCSVTITPKTYRFKTANLIVNGIIPLKIKYFQIQQLFIKNSNNLVEYII